MSDQTAFEERFHANDTVKNNDYRTPYQRDRGRIMHSAAFRRLQGKTQVMGVGEGDFHRTRLTHSVEVAQIGYGLLTVINSKSELLNDEIKTWLPSQDLIEAACLAHDLGHPPFGHQGEKALHKSMLDYGGFEGNGQTLRILTKLEKYKEQGVGINPTRRLILAILKYPCAMGAFDLESYKEAPPKCYHDEEKNIVSWALKQFTDGDRGKLTQLKNNKPQYHTFDCSILELADDIAYGVHDLEDIVARGLVSDKDLLKSLQDVFGTIGGSVNLDGKAVTAKSLYDELLGSSFQRKQQISAMVHMFVSNAEVLEVGSGTFEHPLLRYQVDLPKELKILLVGLKGMAYDLVIRKAKVQQLERRGGIIVTRLFETLMEQPDKLIPEGSWADGDLSASVPRRVCDYIAGMTDGYAQRLYSRLFVPGFGSSSDEL